VKLSFPKTQIASESPVSKLAIQTERSSYAIPFETRGNYFMSTAFIVCSNSIVVSRKK
jgi:hypothetical protein